MSQLFNKDAKRFVYQASANSHVSLEQSAIDFDDCVSVACALKHWNSNVQGLCWGTGSLPNKALLTNKDNDFFSPISSVILSLLFVCSFVCLFVSVCRGGGGG